METYYILRLDKELRTRVQTFRQKLFEETGDSSFCSLEPCIILGPADEQQSIPYCPCPKLPLAVPAKPVYTDGQLYLPIADSVLAPLRSVLHTAYPASGLYLGLARTGTSFEPVLIRDLSVAHLHVEREQDLMLWNVSSEKHLDSGRDHPADNPRSKGSSRGIQSDRTD